MSEFMYSVLVPGGRRKDSCKEIAVSKVSVRTDGVGPGA